MRARSRATSRLPALLRLIAAASLGLVLAACADASGPGTNGDGSSPPPGGGGGSASTAPVEVQLKPGAPPLARPLATFWAVQGRETGTTIEYRPWGGVEPTHPFLQFTLSANTQVIDQAGRALAPGDSIEIEVRVVPGRLKVRLKPEGLRFAGEPARLEISYLYGEVPAATARPLAIYYQPEDGSAWQQARSWIDRQRTAVLADIAHFSNYAVAY